MQSEFSVQVLSNQTVPLTGKWMEISSFRRIEVFTSPPQSRYPKLNQRSKWVWVAVMCRLAADTICAHINLSLNHSLTQSPPYSTRSLSFSLSQHLPLSLSLIQSLSHTHSLIRGACAHSNQPFTIVTGMGALVFISSPLCILFVHWVWLKEY